MKIRTMIVGTVALAAATACSEVSYSGPDPVACDAFLQQRTDVAGDTLATSAGLQFIDIQAGSGRTAAAGTAVSVHYSGYLLDGTRFDTSCPSGQPIRFVVGAGQVIPGFEQGIMGLQPGGVRRLIIPPSLGYGDQPAGSIPANSTLVFDVELVRILNN